MPLYHPGMRGSNIRYIGRICPICGRAKMRPVSVTKPSGSKCIVWACDFCGYRRYPKLTKYHAGFKALSDMVEAEAALLKAAAKKKSGEVA